MTFFFVWISTSRSPLRELARRTPYFGPDAAPTACTLVWMPFRQSTDRRPVSIARIVQRRAAFQNAFRCSVEQNLCADPPVVRAVNVRLHQRQ